MATHGGGLAGGSDPHSRISLKRARVLANRLCAERNRGTRALAYVGSDDSWYIALTGNLRSFPS